MGRKAWTTTTDRFIVFFDILGFKELVSRNSHTSILKKLETLKGRISRFEHMGKNDAFKELKINMDQTKSVTFSDSIIIFSKGNTFKDIFKIILDSYALLKIALEAGIPIKGALSYGQITVDFKKSLFFGQPIIDAYLLHEELQMLTVILDNSFQSKLATFPKNELIDWMTTIYRANLKSGKATHFLIKPDSKQSIESRIKALDDLFLTVSGRPRIYIDNTLDFFNSLLEEVPNNG